MADTFLEAWLLATCGKLSSEQNKELYLLMGSSGSYSDRYDWPVAVYKTKEDAEAAALRATEYSKKRKVILDDWHETTYSPWYWKFQPKFGPGAPDYPDMPKEPKFAPNPDDPENVGEDYWVEAVRCR
jgi:hypothetical protein